MVNILLIFQYIFSSDVTAPGLVCNYLGYYSENLVYPRSTYLETDEERRYESLYGRTLHAKGFNPISYTSEEHRLSICKRLRMLKEVNDETEECTKKNQKHDRDTKLYSFINKDYTKKMKETEVEKILGSMKVDETEFNVFFDSLSFYSQDPMQLTQGIIKQNVILDQIVSLAKQIHENFLEKEEIILKLLDWLRDERNSAYPEISRKKMFLYIAYNIVGSSEYDSDIVVQKYGLNYQSPDQGPDENLKSACLAFNDYIYYTATKASVFLEKQISGGTLDAGKNIVTINPVNDDSIYFPDQIDTTVPKARTNSPRFAISTNHNSGNNIKKKNVNNDDDSIRPIGVDIGNRMGDTNDEDVVRNLTKTYVASASNILTISGTVFLTIIGAFWLLI